MIISIVITIFIVGAIIFKMGVINPAGIAIIVLIILGFLTYVGWMYWAAYILVMLVLIFGTLKTGVITNQGGN